METKENEEPIMFTPIDKGDIIILHNDLMVISTIIVKHPIGRILVDSGSSVNLIYWNYFKYMRIKHNQLKNVAFSLYIFTRETILVAGSI